MTSSGTDPLVIDAGVGYVLCTQDANSASLGASLATRVETGLWLCAPVLWRFELTTIFTKAVHFKQMSESSAREALRLSEDLRVQLVQPDQELVAQAFDWTLRLKRAAAYDSFYLALAQRLGCELWTMDRKLANAADMSWVRYAGEARSGIS